MTNTPQRRGEADGAAAPTAHDILLQACGHGNRLAFEALYRGTSAKLFGVCVHYLHDRTQAEDVLQEAYVAIWLNAGRFDPAHASAITWMACIARNKAIDRRRAQRPLEPLDAQPEPAGNDTVSEAFERDRQRGQLDHCLATLAEDQQRYIRAAFFEGYSYAELATRHSIALGTMKSWVRRGLLQLKACLGL